MKNHSVYEKYLCTILKFVSSILMIKKSKGNCEGSKMTFHVSYKHSQRIKSNLNFLGKFSS